MAEGKAKAGWGFGSKGESVQIDLTQYNRLNALDLPIV